MKDLHKAARQLWQQFADAGVNLNSINFQTLTVLKNREETSGKIELVNIAFNARLVESDDEGHLEEVANRMLSADAPK